MSSPSPSRRDFLQASAGAALSWTLPAMLPAAEETLERRNEQEGMRYRRLGRTRFSVSEIVMGGNEITPTNYEHVLWALDHGLNYLDTSPAYGRGQSELGFAKVLKSRPRDQLFLTSKVSLWDENRNRQFAEIFDSLAADEQKTLRQRALEQIERERTAAPDYFGHYFGAQIRELEAAALSNVMEQEYGRRLDRGRHYRQLIIESVDGSLERLGTDHLDILMCPHGASSPYELTQFPEIFEAFEELKRAGKVRHLGVSAHSDPAGVLRAALQTGVYSVAMLAYNVVNHTFVDAALAEAHARDFGVIAMKVARPVYPGLGRGDGHATGIRRLEQEIPGDWSLPQRAYLWALQNPHLSAAISNMVDLDQVQANLKLPAARQTG
jgi:aryl-alcohol dehydrogenase-like predicted oxidoreductase